MQDLQANNIGTTFSHSAVKSSADQIRWGRFAPFLALHVGCVAVIWVGSSPVAIWAAVAAYVTRMFFITGFYHRYFCHRSFSTSRVAQFAMAALGCTAGQRGPIWWASHHRHHHVHSDKSADAHSPRLRGLIRSHMGWFMTKANRHILGRYVRDWLRYPELRWIERHAWYPFLALAFAAYMLGEFIGAHAPHLGTSGAQMVVWVFGISTIFLYHGTYTINSLAHLFGTRRFSTDDDSRNNALLALLTLGEGWHNNHHHYPASARQGFRWWELDLTFYGLCILRILRIIWNLRPVPSEFLGSISKLPRRR